MLFENGDINVKLKKRILMEIENEGFAEKERVEGRGGEKRGDEKEERREIEFFPFYFRFNFKIKYIYIKKINIVSI